MDYDGKSSDPVLDLDSALARLGGDRVLFGELANYMQEDAPALMQELCAAVDSHDALALRMKAHAIKGLVAGCGGVRTAQAAQSLEDAGATNDLSRVRELTDALKRELSELQTALSQCLQDSSR